MSPRFDKTAQRGRKLLTMILAPENPQSRWTSFSSLAEHSWKVDTTSLPAEDLGGTEKLFSDTTLGSKREESCFVSASIGPAFYTQSFNIHGGSIFAHELLGPAAPKARRLNLDYPRENLPELQHWSDVSFLMWQHLSEGCQRELKCVVHCDITNPTSHDVMTEVLGKNPSSPEAFTTDAYPGFSYTQEDGALFEALLGTPSGMGTGYLLAQHKQEFGGKTVVSIQIFREEHNYFLKLNIGDLVVN